MDKYRVEFGFGENFDSVKEWQTIDGLEEVEAEHPRDAAIVAANDDGLEGALFQVYKIVDGEINWYAPFRFVFS